MASETFTEPRVRYELRPTAGGVKVERVEIMGTFANRAEARQYMIDTTDERKARDV